MLLPPSPFAVAFMQPCTRCRHSVDEYLSNIYGPMVVPSTDGSDFTLSFDASTIPADKLPETIKLVAGLRRNAMACVFDRAFKAAATKGSDLPPEAVVRFRPNEPVYILPRADRVPVIFALEFFDPTDRAIVRIISQEFSEAQRLISTAPPVNFSDKEAPLELRGRKDLPRPSEAFVGYLTFALFPRHFDTEAKRANVINLLTQFRMYLDYHIKAAKSYLHTRMRVRVDGWMQVGGGEREDSNSLNTPHMLDRHVLSAAEQRTDFVCVVS